MQHSYRQPWATSVLYFTFKDIFSSLNTTPRHRYSEMSSQDSSTTVEDPDFNRMPVCVISSSQLWKLLMQLAAFKRTWNTLSNDRCCKRQLGSHLVSPSRYEFSSTPRNGLPSRPERQQGYERSAQNSRTSSRLSTL